MLLVIRGLEQKLSKYYLDNKIVCLFLALISIVAYLPWINHPYSADESTFLLQAHLLSKGIFPIRDFYSHNTPNFLLLYASFMSVFGWNIFVARMVSHLIGAIMGILVYLIVFRDTQNRSVAFLAWLIVQTSRLFLAEGTPLSAMGHALTSSLFILIGIYIILLGHTENKFHLIRMFMFGFCVAFSIWSRHITLVVNVGLFVMGLVLLWCLSEVQKAYKAKATFTSFAGVMTGSAFVFYLFWSRPDTFIYAYLRSTDLIRVMHEVGFDQTLRPWSFEKLALGDFIMSFGGQTALLIAFAACSSLLLLVKSDEYRRCAKAHLLSIWVIISFTGSYLVFSRHGFTWHYLGVLVPFFAIAGSPFIFYSWKEIDKRKLLGVFLLSMVVGHSAYGIRSFYTGMFKRVLTNIFHSEVSIPDHSGVGSSDIGHVKFIAEQVSKLIPSGGKLLSCNSAIFVEMDVIPPFPFGYWESLVDWAYPTKGNRSLNRHHLFTEEQLTDMIKRQYFDVVLVDHLFPGITGGNKKITEKYIGEVTKNYILYKQFGESQIYLPKKQ